jgi:hypothetical protein
VSRWFCLGARVFRLHSIDHTDEPLHFFLEAIDRFKFHASRRGFRHNVTVALGKWVIW